MRGIEGLGLFAVFLIFYLFIIGKWQLGLGYLIIVGIIALIDSNKDD